MHLLIQVKQALAKTCGRESLSYGDCGELVLGRFGRLFINVFLLVTQFGFCCVVRSRSFYILLACSHPHTVYSMSCSYPSISMKLCQV